MIYHYALLFDGDLQVSCVRVTFFEGVTAEWGDDKQGSEKFICKG